MHGIIIFRKYFYPPSETFIYSQVNYLKNFFKVYLVGDKFSIETKYDFSKIEKIELNGFEKKIEQFKRKLFGTNIEPQFQLDSYNQINKLIQKQNIKLIHAHFGTDAIRILPIAKKNKIPLVVTFHGFDASSLINNKWYKEQLPKLFEYASKIIIVSKHMEESLGLSQWKDKVLHLPCSVDVEKFKPSEKNQSDKIHLLHSGRIVNKKGVPDLIRVFAELYKTNKKLHLTVIGYGPELHLCKTESEVLKITDGISFLGAQPHDVVKEIINGCDIFILNSRIADDGDMEGTPVSILEAMSMEKAVVSTYHAGIPEVIKNNFNGILVSEKNNEHLKEAINDLIADKEKRLRLGKQARLTVVSNFSDQKNLPFLSDVLNCITNKLVEIA